MPVGVSAVLDAADVENPVVVNEPESHAIVAPARNPPTRQLESQRLRQPLGVGRQGGGDELRDGCARLARQPTEGAVRRGGKADSPSDAFGQDSP